MRRQQERILYLKAAHQNEIIEHQTALRRQQQRFEELLASNELEHANPLNDQIQKIQSLFHFRQTCPATRKEARKAKRRSSDTALTKLRARLRLQEAFEEARAADLLAKDKMADLPCRHWDQRASVLIG